MTTGYGIDAWGPSAGGGSGDTTKPIVVFDPVAGTSIQRSTIIKVSITDDFLQRSILTAEFPSGSWEVIYLQGRFSAMYVNSIKQPKVNGFDFFVQRVGGWPDVPFIHADPNDASANEAGS